MDKGKLIAQGRTAEVYSLSNTQILKLFRVGLPLSIIENEYHIGNKLKNKGLPIPEMDHYLSMEERVGIVYERIEGPTMMSVISTKPWRINKEARRLAEIHRSIQIDVNEDITSNIEQIKKNIQNSELLNNDHKSKLYDLIDRIPEGSVLCHGDFHPDNIIMSRNKSFVIDWMTATKGNPLSDVARTLIILKYGVVPEHQSRIKIGLINYVRTKFQKEYLNHYIKISGATKKSIEQWEVLHAAARLIEWIPLKEKEVLLKFVQSELS